MTLLAGAKVDLSDFAELITLKGSWTAYTPTFTNVTGGAGGNYFYLQVGKTLFVRGQVPTSGCTATALNILVGFSLPSGITAPLTQALSCAQGRVARTAIYNASTSTIEISNIDGSTSWTAGQSLTNLRWTGVLEVS